MKPSIFQMMYVFDFNAIQMYNTIYHRDERLLNILHDLIRKWISNIQVKHFSIQRLLEFNVQRKPIYRDNTKTKTAYDQIRFDKTIFYNFPE